MLFWNKMSVFSAMKNQKSVLFNYIFPFHCTINRQDIFVSSLPKLECLKFDAATPTFNRDVTDRCVESRRHVNPTACQSNLKALCREPRMTASGTREVLPVGRHSRCVKIALPLWCWNVYLCWLHAHVSWCIHGAKGDNCNRTWWTRSCSKLQESQ